MPELPQDHTDGVILSQLNAEKMNNLTEEKRLSSSLGYVNEAGQEKRCYLLRAASTTPQACALRIQKKAWEVECASTVAAHLEWKADPQVLHLKGRSAVPRSRQCTPAGLCCPFTLRTT